MKRMTIGWMAGRMMIWLTGIINRMLKRKQYSPVSMTAIDREYHSHVTTPNSSMAPKDCTNLTYIIEGDLEYIIENSYSIKKALDV